MNYIYARVSTSLQDTQNQLHKLQERYPDAVVTTEVCSSGKTRPELQALLGKLVGGDTLIVSALDRLGRSALEVLGLIENLTKRDINVVSIREGVDYSTISGRLVTQILCSVAELERNLIRERIVLALQAKRKLGIVGGRRPTFPPEVVKQVYALRSQGLTQCAVARAVGMSQSRVHQLLKLPIAS
jgi:DNA invertase Pin-like site-specific DNA recombinase